MYTQGYAAWRMLVSRSLVMIHCGTTLMCDLPLTPPLKRFLCCFLQQSSNICHHCWIKRVYNSNVFLGKFSTHSEISNKNQNLFVSNRVLKKFTPFMCGLFSLDFGGDYTYKFPLRPLCKGEALKLFSVERQLISFQNGELIFPAAEM
jgi:hypothetical protein